MQTVRQIVFIHDGSVEKCRWKEIIWDWYVFWKQKKKNLVWLMNQNTSLDYMWSDQICDNQSIYAELKKNSIKDFWLFFVCDLSSLCFIFLILFCVKIRLFEEIEYSMKEVEYYCSEEIKMLLWIPRNCHD